MESTPIYVKRTLSAPVPEVWQAITDRDEMAAWYFDLEAFEPKLGFEFQFTGKGHKGEQYVHLCKITEVRHEQKISYSWKYQGYPGESLVSFELEPEGHETRIKLSHSGIETFPKDPDFARERFNAGWTELICNSLKNYLKNKA